MTKNHHYFFAVKLPKEIKTFLYEWINEKREDYPFLKWVHPEDYHITLVFLGFVEESSRDEIIERVRSILASEKSFQLTLSKLGVFGAMKSPRIFWAGVNESDSLNKLQRKLFDECVQMQFSLDKKPFNPHITLARKWGSENEFSKNILVPITTNEGEKVTFTINEVVLYETHLDKIPKYKEFKIFPLL